MPNEIPKGAISSSEFEHDVEYFIAEDVILIDNGRLRMTTRVCKYKRKTWPTSKFLFKNYWDARAYVLKREHDRSTRNKEVPEQGTG